MPRWYVFKIDEDDTLPLIQRIWYRSICRIWRNIKSIPREIKYFIQRGIRGWSDGDVWSFDNYIEGILSGGLIHLADTTQGHPCRGMDVNEAGVPLCGVPPYKNCTCCDDWDRELRENAARFKRLSEENYGPHGPHNTDEEYKAAWKQEEDDDEVAWAWLKRWHGGLWT